jgi:hypothetical protein
VIRLSVARSTALSAIALTAVIFVAGCSSSSAGSSGSGSGSGTTQNTDFRKCLQQHGITPPSGGTSGGGSGAPRPRPTGSASASFRQAIQACGGSFHGGRFGGGSGSAG